MVGFTLCRPLASIWSKANEFFCQFTDQSSSLPLNRSAGHSSVGSLLVVHRSQSTTSKTGQGSPPKCCSGSRSPFELTHSNCSLRPLITGNSRLARRRRFRLHSIQNHHWSSCRGALNVVQSTWRDPQFEFYLVSAHLYSQRQPRIFLLNLKC